MISFKQPAGAGGRELETAPYKVALMRDRLLPPAKGGGAPGVVDGRRHAALHGRAEEAGGSKLDG
jgi:hypothetical protein